MTPAISKRLTRDLRDQSGMALLISVIVLLLMSALALSALQHASEESTGSGTARRKDSTLYAAESGMAVYRTRLFNASYGTAGPDGLTLNEPTLVTDSFGSPIHVMSGSPDNGDLPGGGDTPSPLTIDKQSFIPPGYEKNLQTNGGMSFMGALADITARDAGAGLVHLQSQFRIPSGEAGNGTY
ncbi:MAG TPA: PilX N-terminal domain-containing pilus assembly protein [Myxococcota bacterium]|nr:PilX N-terminal domain-containing pilus assembly protein [Myxococcota bacterium]